MSALIPANFLHSRLRKQHGAALMVMLVLVIIGSAAFLVSALSGIGLQLERDKNTTDALAQAKEALIGKSVFQSTVTSSGYLPLPDLGVGISTLEGSSALPSFTGNAIDYSIIGKVPWKTLGTPPLRDKNGECLWYVVSGRFKNNPTTNSPLNWDTSGQIDVIDANGNIIANNLAALLVAPGLPLDGQNRTLSDPTYTQCGGNYDTRNYLDSYNPIDAVSGEVNYFANYASYTNNKLAPNVNNKRFVMANNNHYNDQFLFVTTNDIFRPIIHRSDFAAQISALMNDAYFQTVTITGTKGIDSVVCGSLSTTANQTFCVNWKEMLLLTQLPSTASITIDSTPTLPICNRVLIFGGQKISTQLRITSSDKSSPSNYLEGTNLTAFSIPIAFSNNFNGTSTFKTNDLSADILKCLL